MVANVDTAPRTYGNWKRESVAGYFGLGPKTAAVFYGLILVALIALFNRWWLTLGGAVVVMALIQILYRVRDRHHRHTGDKLATMLGWQRQKLSGANLYRSGPLGVDRLGKNRLPGLAARSELLEVQDALGRDFCIIRSPARRHYTVVLSANPDGNALVDQDQVDTWVAMWGNFLAAVGDEARLVGFTVTIETAPDSGAMLTREVNMNTSSDAPEFAQHYMQEVLDTFPEGAAATTAWLAFTYQMEPGATKDQHEFIRFFQSRMTFLSTHLQGTGVGSVTPVTADELCEYIRVSYDPAAATLVEDARAAGESLHLDWEETGPSAYDAGWDSFRHDSGTSVSWYMSQAPRGHVISRVLEPLLEPIHLVERKRVTLIYRPIPSEEAGEMVVNDSTSARHRATRSNADERDSMEYQQAKTTEREEAQGAGLVRFGMIVTATTRNPDNLDQIVTAVEARGRSAGRIRLRRAWATQASAFAAALPLGVVLPEQISIRRGGQH